MYHILSSKGSASGYNAAKNENIHIPVQNRYDSFGVQYQVEVLISYVPMSMPLSPPRVQRHFPG